MRILLFVFLTSLAWAQLPLPGGASFSSGSGDSGALFTPAVNQTSTSVDWQDTSVLAKLRGESLYALPSTWKVRMRFTAGSPVIGSMKILRTLAGSTSVIDSTTVTIGGQSGPTLASPGMVETDAIALALDSSHDYYFVIYFTNAAANNTVSVVSTGGGPLVVGWVAGDQTGVSTIPAMNTTNSPYLVIGGIF